MSIENLYGDTIENYEDLPMTNFPVSEDNYARMTDVTNSLLPLVIQYNDLYKNGKLTEASQLLKDNPSLAECMFNADKYNQLRDGLIAMQRYQRTQLDDLYHLVANAAVGINDNPTPDIVRDVAYSASKVESMFDVKDAVLAYADWSANVPYTQTVAIKGVRETDTPTIACAAEVLSENQKKVLIKNWSYVDDIVTGENQITAYCYFKKPSIDLPLIIKGV